MSHSKKCTRQRIEDLGRISEIVKNLTEHELFEWKYCRDKDTAEWFLSLDDEKKFEIIHSLAYSITHLENKLYELYEIARYGDSCDDC
jgi:hypothetical protein